MDQIVQVIGAVLILAAFLAAQMGRLSPHAPLYLALNLVGSIALAIVALTGSNWGFVLLETVWAIVSLWGLIALARGPSGDGQHA
jgi:hypothetical protein